ncbi:MAG: C1 family peptidase, partial [Isosphaeraceae bacterium]
RLEPGQLETFVEQFGRLKNDMPTFQIRPERYYVLIPLNELERQPAVGPAPQDRPKATPAPRPAPQEEKAGKGANPAEIDGRGRQSPVRDQGHRGTCVAFAACAELEALLLKSHPGRPIDLSENMAYYCFMKEEESTPCADPGLATFRAAGYLKKHLVGEESLWKYVGTDPDELNGAKKCALINDIPSVFQGKMGWGVDEFVMLPAANEVTPDGTIDIKDTRTLERLLAQGQDIVFGTIVAWNNTDARGIIDVKLGPAGQPIFGAGGHAMAIVGYRSGGTEKDRRPYFIVKNSWGADYGHGGYLFMTYDYLRTYARYGYTTTRLRSGKIDLKP